MGVFNKLKETINKKKNKTKETVSPDIDVESMMEFAKHRQAIRETEYDKYCISKYGQSQTISTYKYGFNGPMHYMDKDGYVFVSFEHTTMQEIYRDSGDYEVKYPEQGRFVYMNDAQNGYEVVRLSHEDIVQIQNTLGLTQDKDTATQEKEGM